MAINSAFCPQCGTTVTPTNATVDAETLRNEERPIEVTDTEVIAATEPPATQDPVDNEPKARRRASRKPLLISTVVVLVLVASSVVVLAIRGHHTTGLTSHLVSEKLPLHVCNTTFGIPTMKAINLPSHENEMVPQGSAGNLVIYSDSMGTMKLLGPQGWGCNAIIGADGGIGITIAPVDSSSWSPSVTLNTDSTVEEINGTFGLTGNALSQACSLFVAAQKIWAVNGQKCYPTRPASETVLRLNQNSVEFVDPPHLHGNGNPSGGAYPASGVVTFYGGQEPVSQMETCVLPPNQQSLCSVTLRNFAWNYGSK
jgi:hypothetical protein